MSDYITLLGAEDVRAASNTMYGAAEEMKRAAATMDFTAERQRQFMDDWLNRFEAAIDRLAATPALGATLMENEK